MIAVILETRPAGRDQEAELTAGLYRIPGFVSVERFESLATPGKYLSLSFFTDEDAAAQWRGLWGHGAAQTRAQAHPEDCRLRIAWVSRDSGTAPAGAKPDCRSE